MQNTSETRSGLNFFQALISQLLIKLLRNCDDQSYLQIVLRSSIYELVICINFRHGCQLLTSNCETFNAFTRIPTTDPYYA